MEKSEKIIRKNPGGAFTANVRQYALLFEQF
jgi:hypothetical protein